MSERVVLAAEALERSMPESIKSRGHAVDVARKVLAAADAVTFSDRVLDRLAEHFQSYSEAREVMKLLRGMRNE